MKLVILDGYAENPGDLSWDGLNGLVEWTAYDLTPPELVLERCAQADIVVTNKTPLTRELIEQLPKLKFIALLSTGYNVVDCSAAGERGIPVSNIPAYSTNGVAQLVFAFLLELSVNVALHSDSVRSGEWSSCPHFCYWKTPLSELSGKTLGIIGYGKIGRAVRKIAEAFGMNVLIYTSHPSEDDPCFVSLSELLERADAVTLHCPLTDKTEGMVDSSFLSKMKSTAYLINTSRGQVIVEDDLAKSLNSGVIAGAGLDVLRKEPADSNNPLLKAKNCLITPHIAWAALETRQRLMDIFVGNVKAFVEGKPMNVVN